MSTTVTYARNITTNPTGAGITVDGMILQSSTLGPTQANLGYSQLVSLSGTAQPITASAPQSLLINNSFAQTLVMDLVSTFANGATYRINNTQSGTTTATIYAAGTKVTTGWIFPTPSGNVFVYSNSLLPASGSFFTSSTSGIQTIAYTSKVSTATTVDVLSNNVSLPATTINVASTSGFIPTVTTTITDGSNGVAINATTFVHVGSVFNFNPSGSILVTTSLGPQLVTYTGVASAATSVTVGSNGATLPQSIIYAASVSSFPSSGPLLVATSLGNQVVTYTGTTNFSTTIAVASNGVVLPFVGGTLNVASSASFPSSGTILVTSNAGVQVITYASKPTGTTFGGCNGGTGTLSTGGAVNMITFTGCTGGTGTLSTGGAINAIYFSGCTTSGGGVMSTGNLVEAPGKIVVTTSAGPQVVTYTGPNTATQFIGCSGGTGTMTTGGAVTQHRLAGCTGGTGTVVANELVWHSSMALLTLPSLYQGEITCVDNTGTLGAFGWNAFLYGTVVMDNAASPPYPQDLTRGVWYGSNTKANAYALDDTSIILGNNGNTDFTNSIAINQGNASGSASQIALGYSTTVTGSSPINNFGGIAYGYLAQAIASDTGGSIALGRSAVANANNAIAIHGSAFGATSAQQRGIAIGGYAMSAQTDGVVIGVSGMTAGVGCVSGGRGSTGSSNYSVAAGGGLFSGPNTTGNYNIRLGMGGSVSANFAQSIGGGSTYQWAQASVSGLNAIGIGGRTHNVTVPNGICIGVPTSETMTNPAYAFKIMSTGNEGINNYNMYINNTTRSIEYFPSIFSILDTDSTGGNAFLLQPFVGTSIGAPRNYATTGSKRLRLGIPVATPSLMVNGYSLTIYNLNTIWPTTVTTSISSGGPPVSATTITYNDILPTATIRVASTTIFPTSGSIYINASQLVNYTGIQNAVTTISYADTLPTGTIRAASSVAGFTASGTILVVTNSPNIRELITYTSLQNFATTIAAGSNGVDLSTNPGVINVASSIPFPGSGTLVVVTSLGPQLVNYTTKSFTTTFNGVTGGAGIMSTGASVTMINFLGCTGGGPGTSYAVGASVEQIAFTGCTYPSLLPTPIIYGEIVEPFISLIMSNTQENFMCVDATVPQGGWVTLPKKPATNVPQTLKAVVVPNNYNAAQKGVQIGELYTSYVNGSTTPATFAITSSTLLTTLTVTVTAGVIPIGAFLSGGGVAAGTLIVSQLTGTFGGIGTYQINISQTSNPTTVNYSTASGDALYVRTV